MTTTDMDALVRILKAKELDCKTVNELQIVRDTEVMIATYIALSDWTVDPSLFVAQCRKGVTTV